MSDFHCLTCGANWSAGDWTRDCKECGGGALGTPCLVCGGRCGSTWDKAVLDTIDSSLAHWSGVCNLPKEEQQAIRDQRSP